MSRRDELKASLLVVLHRAGRIKYLQFSHALTAEEFFQADGILRKSRADFLIQIIFGRPSPVHLRISKSYLSSRLSMGGCHQLSDRLENSLYLFVMAFNFLFQLDEFFCSFGAPNSSLSKITICDLKDFNSTLKTTNNGDYSQPLNDSKLSFRPTSAATLARIYFSPISESGAPRPSCHHIGRSARPRQGSPVFSIPI